MQIIHHLIARKETPDCPVACSEKYEDAADFVKVELEGKGVVSLHLDNGTELGHCPYCLVGSKVLFSGRIALPEDHPAFE